MLFTELVQVFVEIEKTSLRNEMMMRIAELIKRAETKEVMPLVYLAMGELRPKYDRLEFNLADKMVVRAIARAVGEKPEQIMGQYKTIGDLGEVIFQRIGESANQQMSHGMSVIDVYTTLEKIARDSGTGSQERKIDKLAKLLIDMDAVSAKYIVRIVLGKLRLGFSDKTILDALSYMENGTKESREILDQAYQVAPDVAELSRLVKEVGATKAREIVTIKIGRPMMPALAQRLRTADEMIAKMGMVEAEPKYDGTRVQIHFKKSGFESATEEQNASALSLFDDDSHPRQVRTFTRNLDENTEMFPELKNIFQQINADEVILDSEGVGYDPETGKMVPFQMTITRKRKHEVAKATASVPIRFFVFDILYKDGEMLIDLPLTERRKILSKTVKEGKVLVVDEAIVTDNPSKLREYHAKQLEKGLEGVLVKKVAGKYLPGRQDWNWVKFKEEEGQAGKLADTVDAIVMGYYKGKGKRQKFGVGAFLVGIRQNEQVVTLAKIGTGLTDEQFRELYVRLQKCIVKQADKSYVVDKNLVPDVWVNPEIVVEIAADEVTVSPIHSSGYALRFPRLVRFRDDKTSGWITTRDELMEIGGLTSGI